MNANETSFNGAAGGAPSCGARGALSRRLLTAASAAALAAAAPALIAPAHAQLAAGCTPSNPTAGQTAVCTGAITETISSSVDDLTVNVGVDGGATGTVTTTTGDGVSISGAGAQTVNVFAGSSILVQTDFTARGIDARSADGGAVTIDVRGSVDGLDSGVYARTGGAGNITVTATAEVSANYGEALDVELLAGATGNVVINSTAEFYGYNDAISVRNRGSGEVTVNVADLGSFQGSGVTVINQTAAGGDISVTSTGAIDAGFRGADITNVGAGGVVVDLASVTGNGSDGVFVDNQSAGPGDVSITASGAVVGRQRGIDVRHGGTGAVAIDVAAVTGQDFDGVYAEITNADAGDLSITASGAISGSDNGILVESEGSGAVTLNVAAVSGAGADGIEVDNDSDDAGDISITASGVVSGRIDGIEVDQSGTGGVALNVNAVTGAQGDGIVIDNETGSLGGVTLTAAGAISGAYEGVQVQNAGTGGVMLDVAGVSGAGGDGIRVSNGSASTGGLSITASGAVSGGADGVDASNSGYGALTIDVAGVSATSGNGIRVFNESESTGDVSITATGAVTGETRGVYVNNQGIGGVTLSLADVTANTEQGVYVRNDGYSTGDVSITASGAVTGETRGVYVNNQGTGGVTVATGAVTGNTEEGILVENSSNSDGGVSITATGRVESVGAAENGVNVDNTGAGGVTVNVADVYGSDGINIRNTSNSAGGVTVTASGDVTGSSSGVQISHQGTGGVTIDVQSVAGNSREGIDLSTASNTSGDISITAAGAVFGGRTGVYLEHDGRGDVSVDVADVSSASFGNGIEVRTNTIGGDVSVRSTGSVSGRGNGVWVLARGDGAVEISVADVAGVNADGIHASHAYSDDASDALSITASGDVSGDDDGIYASSDALGGVTIDVAGAVSGTSGHGVHINNDVNGGSVSVDLSGAVTGGENGVLVENGGGGAGNVNIRVAAVTGTNAAGVAVSNSEEAFTGDMSITATGAVTGETLGVYVDNQGTGGVYVSVTSVAGGAGGVGNGVRLENGNSNGSGDVVFRASGAVSGGENGVDIGDYGAGSVLLDVAAVSATSGDGIYASNDGGGDIVAFASGAVSGGQNGIRARNLGAGGVGIIVADVSGASGNGIYASNDQAGDEIVVTSSGAVSGGQNGIRARNRGTGGVALNVAAVSGTSENGIRVSAAGEGDIVVIASGAVSGGQNGVLVDNPGSGDVRLDLADVDGGDDGIAVFHGFTTGEDVVITASGDVTGGRNGVYIYNYSGGAGDISVTSSGAVSGGSDGVSVTNLGTGGVSADLADVEGGSGDGVSIENSAASLGDIMIAASGDVSGGVRGVDVTNEGAGDVSVALLGDVAGGSSGALNINNEGAGGVTVSVGGDITKTASAGVNVLNDGDGGVSINVGGGVSGAGNGVAANNAGDGALMIAVGGDIDITTSAGVQATNRGDGDVSITTNGAVRNSGVGFGVLASNEGAGDVSIVAGGDVSGSFEGIFVSNTGGGATEIALSGAVSTSGGDVFGLRTEAAAGAAVTIGAGGSVTGGAGAVSFDGGGADVLTLNSGASLDGLAAFNGGDDVLRLAGGTFTEADGGDGTDAIFLSGASRTVDGFANGDGEAVSGFETLNIDGDGLTLAGTFSGFESATFLAGENGLAGTLAADAVSIAQGATLIAGGLTPAEASSVGGISASNVDIPQINGDLTNEGVLNIAGSGAIGRLEVAGDYIQEESGVLIVDVQGGSSDVLSVGGDVAVAGDLVVEGTLTGAQTGDNTIRLIEGDGVLSGRLNVIADDGLLLQRELVFDDAEGNVDLVVTLNDLSMVEGLNRNQDAVGDTLLALIGEADLDTEFADFIGGILSLDTDGEIRDVLAQLHPEALDIGLKSLAVSQRSFTQSMLARAQDPRLDGTERAVLLPAGGTLWGSIQGAGLGQDGRGDNFGFDGNLFSLSAGIADMRADRFSFGFAGGFSEFNGETDGSFGDDIESRFFHIGASVSADLNDIIADGWLMRNDTVVAYAGGDAELSMALFDPRDGERFTQRGDADLRSFDASSRFTLEGVNGEKWPVRPHADFGVQAYRQEATQITSTQPTGLLVDALNNTIGFAGVGVSYEKRLGDNVVVHGRATGMRYFGDTENVFNSRFSAAPDGPAFRTASHEIDTQVELEAAFDYWHKSGFKANMTLFGETGDLDAYGARFSISRRF